MVSRRPVLVRPSGSGGAFAEWDGASGGGDGSGGGGGGPRGGLRVGRGPGGFWGLVAPVGGPEVPGTFLGALEGPEGAWLHAAVALPCTPPVWGGGVMVVVLTVHRGGGGAGGWTLCPAAPHHHRQPQTTPAAPAPPLPLPWGVWG